MSKWIEIVLNFFTQEQKTQSISYINNYTVFCRFVSRVIIVRTCTTRWSPSLNAGPSITGTWWFIFPETHALSIKKTIVWSYNNIKKKSLWFFFPRLFLPPLFEFYQVFRLLTKWNYYKLSLCGDVFISYLCRPYKRVSVSVGNQIKIETLTRFHCKEKYYTYLNHKA